MGSKSILRLMGLLLHLWLNLLEVFYPMPLGGRIASDCPKTCVLQLSIFRGILFGVTNKVVKAGIPLLGTIFENLW